MLTKYVYFLTCFSPHSDALKYFAEQINNTGLGMIPGLWLSGLLNYEAFFHVFFWVVN